MQWTRNTYRRLIAATFAAVFAASAGATVIRAVDVATFVVSIEGNVVANASAYDINSENSRRHVLKLSLVVLDDGDPSPYQPGQTVGTTEVKLLATNLATIKTYTLATPVVESVRRRGDASTNRITEEVTLVGKSLVIAP